MVVLLMGKWKRSTLGKSAKAKNERHAGVRPQRTVARQRPIQRSAAAEEVNTLVKRARKEAAASAAEGRVAVVSALDPRRHAVPYPASGPQRISWHRETANHLSKHRAFIPVDNDEPHRLKQIYHLMGTELLDAPTIKVYADGGFTHPNFGGIGCFFPGEERLHISRGVYALSSVDAELLSCIAALERIGDGVNAVIYTDCLGVIAALGSRSTFISLNPIAARLFELVMSRDGSTQWYWVKGHAHMFGNEEADRLATLGKQGYEASRFARMVDSFSAFKARTLIHYSENMGPAHSSEPQAQTTGSRERAGVQRPVALAGTPASCGSSIPSERGSLSGRETELVTELAPVDTLTLDDLEGMALMCASKDGTMREYVVSSDAVAVPMRVLAADDPEVIDLTGDSDDDDVQIIEIT
ncbi:hypothetical protein HDU85_004549 [Gaertneriomyces sp. JEL0708]|nr:hypothetical protein HDU85_004549 [Gaertneriomyces sp. JEL0708]